MKKSYIALLLLLNVFCVADVVAQDEQPLHESHPIQIGVRLKEVPPVYPPVARAAKISGDVLLHVIINADGTVRSIEPIRGHALLVPAAITAVKQWVYKPYELNGKPTAVDTTVTVHFKLEDPAAVPVGKR